MRQRTGADGRPVKGSDGSGALPPRSSKQMQRHYRAGSFWGITVRSRRRGVKVAVGSLR